MLRSAVGALGEQLREAQQQAADIQVGGWGLLAGAGAVEAANVPEGWVLDTSEAGRPQAGSRHCAARQHCPFLGPLCLLLQERAARMIENSSKLREQMGGSVQVMPPVSQSSMSSSVNGRSAKTVTLLMPVVGASGRTAQVRGSCAAHYCCLMCILHVCAVCECALKAVPALLPTPTVSVPPSCLLQAQVQFTEGTGTASEKLSVIVRLPNGGVLNLDSDNSLTTQTIDVEWRSVDDK
jgi:hypothetical protein